MMGSPQPGEVWTVDFGYGGKVRSALVISVADSNCRLAIASVVQITTQYGGTPYEATLPRVPWLREQSYCNAQTVQPVAWVEFQRKLGQFDSRILGEVRLAVKRWLGL
ncbi:MAG TPA: type II toxin-antitoxin system PemK/MazF family toxin [Verrucomicrobiota bacterium]|nr:type II toxin-antitoxin system PemK/MazF family toxin [Verrucomicrobiota bacterium]HRT08462.1 type II toxin-antitoxin system PemK/MazF family toxin [Candidatus Paceibacterota bacterium]HRT58190.1 type II toxin-antitoxin system PemK/MazF family toxin [Candidatus Paceibacterota bacterium]